MAARLVVQLRLLLVLLLLLSEQIPVGFISESTKRRADDFAAGSIIGPASFTNIVGVRPTLSLTSQDGVIPIS